MTVQNIGRYRILRELGRGTLATVYLARDPASGQQVSVKVLAENFTSAPDFDDRFQAEMQALKALEHPALVKLVDYGQEGGQYFVVGRYLPGGTLADRLEGRPLLLAEVVPILKRLAEALDAAHTAGIAHGNLSPANVLFDLHERSFLADLGLSHLVAPAAGPELSGAPEYMSPEQAQGGAIDGRADVYSLGAMLYEMLTGQRPFSAESAFQLLRQHVEQPVPQLSDEVLARLVLPAEFNQVLARAMAKNPDDRYPTAGVLAEAVRSQFVMPPADAGATVPVAARAILAGAAGGSSPPPAGGAAVAAAPEPSMVGELVREPEPPAGRVLAMPMLLGLGAAVIVLLLLAIWGLPAIAGRLSRTATPTQTATIAATTAPQATTASPRPTSAPSATTAAQASATTRASAVPLVTATRTPTTAPSRTLAPTATTPPTSTNTRAPAFTLTPTQTDTQIPPTETATATTTAPPPPPATNTSVPIPTVTDLPTLTATNTPSNTPIPSNTPAPLPR